MESVGLGATGAAAHFVPPYRLLVVKATKDVRQLGLLLGQQYKEYVLAGRERWLNYYVKQETTTTEEQVAEFTAHATVAIRQCCPTVASFLDGLSEGTGVDMYSSMLDFELENWDHIVTLRKKQEKATARATKIKDAVKLLEAAGRPIPDGSVNGHCTGLAFSSSSDPTCAVVAQTVELPLKLYGQGDRDVVLHLEWPDPSGGAPRRALCYDTDGRCCPVGFNSAGLAIGVFTLKQKQEHGYCRPSVTVQAILWEFMLGGHTVATALDFLSRLPLQCMTGAALLLADPRAAANVELNPDGVHGDPAAPDRLLRRANHPLVAATKAFDCNTALEEKYSVERLKRLDTILETQGKKPRKKQVNLDRMKVGAASALAALCGSNLICNTRALAVVVSDLGARRLYCLFKERWPASGPHASGPDRRRLETGKQQVHKVRRKLYLYDIDDITTSHSVDDSDMDEDLEGAEEEVGTETESDSSRSGSGSSVSIAEEEESDDEEEEEGEGEETPAEGDATTTPPTSPPANQEAPRPHAVKEHRGHRHTGSSQENVADDLRSSPAAEPVVPPAALVHTPHRKRKPSR